MSLIAAISNVQTSFPSEVVSQTEVLVTLSLVISLGIGLLISDSKYLTLNASSTLEACSNPLLLTFAGIVVYKIMLIV
ncbi:MAG: hypothetical protein OIN87_05505 [Candidatus Methanoperedens sp.]|nr:hypothetical protein [Candidatus Methanoperedens sp.]